MRTKLRKVIIIIGILAIVALLPLGIAIATELTGLGSLLSLNRTSAGDSWFAMTMSGVAESKLIINTGYVQIFAPTGLVLTYVNDYEVDISWTLGVNAYYSMVRGAIDRIPEDRDDGYLVYYGTATSCTDHSVKLGETVIYYRVWSQSESLVWEDEGIDDSIGGKTMIWIGLLIFCVGISFLSLRSKFLLLKLLAGAAWVALFVFWMDSPPGTIEKGSPPHIAVMVVIIGLAVCIPIMGLGREIETQQDWRSGLSTETSGAFHFKLPSWLKSPEAANKEQRRQSTSEYRERLHNAINQPSKREKRK